MREANEAKVKGSEAAVRTISGVLVGETLEIDCHRRVASQVTLTVAVKERLLGRMLRMALRRPAPTKTIPWTESKWEKVGQTIWVIGTEDGPVARDTSPYPEDE